MLYMCVCVLFGLVVLCIRNVVVDFVVMCMLYMKLWCLVVGMVSCIVLLLLCCMCVLMLFVCNLLVILCSVGLIVFVMNWCVLVLVVCCRMCVR